MSKKKVWRIVVAFIAGVIALITINLVVSSFVNGAESELSNTSNWHPFDKASKAVDYGKWTGIDWAVTLFSIYLGIKLLIWFVIRLVKEFVDGDNTSKEVAK